MRWLVSALAVLSALGCDRVIGLDEDYYVAGDRVTSLTLIDAKTDQAVPGFDPLLDGAVIDTAQIGHAQLNLRANTKPEVVGSVRFGLDGTLSHQIENDPPYALAKDTLGDYSAWSLAPGEHTVTATPFTEPDAKGEAGAAAIVTFTLILPAPDGG